MIDSPEAALQEAIKKAGGQAALGTLIGVTQQAVSWMTRHSVSPWHAITIEAATGIPRWRLRPDHFPRPEEVAA